MLKVMRNPKRFLCFGKEINCVYYVNHISLMSKPLICGIRRLQVEILLSLSLYLCLFSVFARRQNNVKNAVNANFSHNVTERALCSFYCIGTPRLIKNSMFGSSHSCLIY